MADTGKQLVAEQVAYKREAGIPLAKFTLLVEITANSHEELSRRIHGLDVNWDYDIRDRDEMDSTDGTTSILLVHTNPEQTPERYHDELMSWSAERKAQR